jgi:hypothetical protein
VFASGTKCKTSFFTLTCINVFDYLCLFALNKQDADSLDPTTNHKSEGFFYVWTEEVNDLPSLPACVLFRAVLLHTPTPKLTYTHKRTHTTYSTNKTCVHVIGCMQEVVSVLGRDRAKLFCEAYNIRKQVWHCKINVAQHHVCSCCLNKRSGMYAVIAFP